MSLCTFLMIGLTDLRVTTVICLVLLLFYLLLRLLLLFLFAGKICHRPSNRKSFPAIQHHTESEPPSQHKALTFHLPQSFTPKNKSEIEKQRVRVSNRSGRCRGGRRAGFLGARGPSLGGWRGGSESQDLGRFSRAEEES
ncbi:hypothetical protein DEO72_LG3g1325 [Vigna unguiculata]|uniref:Uncharacterized protein n=1 Tax=Vigna unguiculata TaxID=3917 RepID=A0A4D6LDX3_VIGUN|nr:hypothetical protein DEO72_LG3g1325 [Vigna unguiculata]